MSTALEVTQLAEIARLVSAGKLSLTDLMEKLAAKPEPPAPGEVAKPKQIVLSPADKTTLRTLPRLLADLELPAEARQLTDAERTQLVPVFDKVKVAKSAVTKAEDAIKEAFHNHLDATTDGPLGKNGHKLTEGEIEADGYDKKAVRGLVGGNAVELTVSDLQELVKQEKITNAQFLRMTKPRSDRVLVPEAVMAEINKDSEMLAAIASVARRTDQTTAIRMAKA